jgi:glutamate formiminotransferase
VIGLLPQMAYEQESEWMRLLDGFDPATKVLERRLEAPQDWPEL